MASSKRQFDSKLITEQRWFVQLPSHEYRLFFMWIISNCDIGGIWDPEPYPFELAYNTTIDLDDFVTAVNAGRKPNEAPRITVLKNKHWFVVGFFKFQSLGTKICISSGNHRAVLTSWCKNEIHPFDVFGEHSPVCQDLTNDNLKLIGYPDRVSIPYPYPTDTLSLGYAYPSDRVRLERESIKGEDLRDKVGDPLSNPRENDLIISSNTSLSQKKSPEKKLNNPAEPEGSAKRRGRPRKESPPLVALEPELVCVTSGDSIAPKQVAPVPNAKPVKKEIVLPWPSDEFKAAWQEWKDYKQSRADTYPTDPKEKYPFNIRKVEEQQLENLRAACLNNEQEAIYWIKYAMGVPWKNLCKPNQTREQYYGKPTTGKGSYEIYSLANGQAGEFGVRGSASVTNGPAGSVRGRGGSFADLEALKRGGSKSDLQ